MLVMLGKRAWLHCDDCRHSIMIEPHELAQCPIVPTLTRQSICHLALVVPQGGYVAMADKWRIGRLILRWGCD